MDMTRLKSAAEQIEMPEDMKNRIIDRVSAKHPRRMRTRRSHMVLLAAALCLVLSVPVLAAATEPAYQLLYRLAPAAAQFFRPVCRSDEDRGVRMDVISARASGNTAQIYIALRDLEGDRVDETVDLNDSYSIHRPFDSSANCVFAGYEKETGTAYFLVTITEYGDWDITGEKITFSVRELLSHKLQYNGVEIPVDWSAVGPVTELWENVDLIGCGGLESGGFQQHDFLIPNKNPIHCTAINGIDFTGIGFVDGKLHIQTAVRDKLQNDNHGFLYLEDRMGNVVNPAYSVSAQDSSSGTRVDYQEYVFDVSADMAGKYRLRGDFETSGQWTQGSWQVTFPIES